MNSTAIAARIIPITLEIMFVQWSPKTLYNLLEFINIVHVAAKASKAAATAIWGPLSAAKITIVVIVPGPVSNGVPIGTAKSWSWDFINLPEMPKTKKMLNISNIMPPAIMKLFMLMLKKSNIWTPRNRKINNKVPATSIDLLTFFFISTKGIPFVRLVNIDKFPIGSITTNSVMNALSKPSILILL